MDDTIKHMTDCRREWWNTIKSNNTTYNHDSNITSPSSSSSSSTTAELLNARVAEGKLNLTEVYGMCIKQAFYVATIAQQQQK